MNAAIISRQECIPGSIGSVLICIHRAPCSRATCPFQMITRHLHERRLQIEGRIGCAYESEGAAYTGMRDDIGRKVAIKILALHRMTDDEIADLQHEALILRSLSHENVIGPAEHFVKSSILYCITNLMDLGSVRRILDLPDYANGIPENTIAAIMKQLGEALVYVHAAGIVHRGIRCSHILCSSNGRE
uniref:Protein kinase domain-containing protein n=1 Tax=Steinernema glaseri TaxID=37863 RepID=A0A1I7ZFU9_9BILA